MENKFNFLSDEQKRRLIELESEYNNISAEIALIYAIEEHDHVDTFIDLGTHQFDYNTPEHDLELYARWWLSLRRLPASAYYDFKPIISKDKLFCTWNGRRMRVTGASRLGDIWLTRNFKNDTGYQERVQYSECSEWNKYSKVPLGSK